jgi:hypothetical protein
MKKFAILLLTVCCLAQDKPLPELSRLRLVNAFRQGIILQQQLQAAQSQVVTLQQQLNAALVAWQAVQAGEAAANGLPKGTTFEINNDTGAVKTVPPKKEEKKPEEKK